MKLGILALDYDGTIAVDGALDREVGAALRRAREQGIVVVLVTGRILDDLRRVAGDLRFVDAVVAENGAVLAFPENGRTIVLGNPAPKSFLAALGKQGIPATAGECVVETDAEYGQAILALIREMELPLVLAYNRGRLMILPQGVSKATGLRRVLSVLRLSEHNAIGIGDAENDHALLETCELGVAAAWGSKALQAVADQVLSGDGPTAVAGYVEQAAASARIPSPRTGRRKAILGYTPDGREISLPILGRNVLVVGDPRSGKSWIAGLLAEQLILHRYCVCVIDPEGDYRTLESLPGVMVLGGQDPPPRPREVTQMLRYPDVSTVIDLSELKHHEKCEYVSSLLRQLAALRRQTGLPHRIVLDEAHYFLNGPDSLSLIDLDFEGYTLVTYRLSQLYEDVRNSAEVLLATRVTDPSEVQTLLSMSRSRSDIGNWQSRLAGLSISEAVLFIRSLETMEKGELFTLAPRFTLHVRHQQKYLGVDVLDRNAFVFTQNYIPTGRRAGSLKEFLEILGNCPSDVLDGHLRRGDFSRWIADVLGDYPLAAQLRTIEHLYRLHQVLGVRDAIAQAISDRYILSDEVG